MNIVGSFSREVGILYAIDKAIELGKDIWFTDDAFTYYIGAVADNKYVVVPKAFLTDGASVPRAFWSFFPPWGIYGQAAVLHDYLCVNRVLTMNGEVANHQLTTKEIDQIFYGAMKVSGTPVWKRAIIYGAVRLYHGLRL